MENSADVLTELRPATQPAEGKVPVSEVGPKSPVVSARGLRRTWGEGEGATMALAGVDVSIGSGELVTIVGPSGSGKSTLGAILAGIDRPDAGAVTAGGIRIDKLRPEPLARWRAANVGIVFQEPHLMSVLSAEENVALALRVAGVRRGRRRLARSALADVGLSKRRDHYPSQLSGGERQRVGIARALVTRPRFVVADEPTGALDQVAGHVVFDLLRDLTCTGTSVVLITHDLALARSADRTVELVDGMVTSEVRR